MKLEIELVPSTAWYSNLRNSVSPKGWNKIRKKAYSDYGYRCGICKAKGRLNCHEIWRYDDEKHIQKLEGFIALCDMCHHVKHIGLTGILSDEGKLDYGEVIKHFMKVNKCGKNTFEKHRQKAFTQWRERSEHEWKTDLGKYKKII